MSSHAGGVALVSYYPLVQRHWKCLSIGVSRFMASKTTWSCKAFSLRSCKAFAYTRTHTQAPSMDTFRTCCSNVPHPCIHAYMYFCKFIPNRQGRLMKPGDMLMNGTELKSTKCAGRQDAVIYTSNTVCYAHTHRNRHINICMHIHIHKVTDTRAHRHIHIYIHTQMTTFYSWRQHCRLVCA